MKQPPTFTPQHDSLQPSKDLLALNIKGISTHSIPLIIFTQLFLIRNRKRSKEGEISKLQVASRMVSYRNYQIKMELNWP